MKRNGPSRHSLMAFVKVISKAPKVRYDGNRSTLKNLCRPEVREELNVQGVAILSDN